MQLTTAQNTLQQHQRHSIKRDGKLATPIVKPTTHNLWQHQNSHPLAPRLRLGTHCHRGSAASPLQTKPNQLRHRIPNRPTSPAPTYNTLRWATPHRTTAATQPRQIPSTTTATTTTPVVTTAKLASSPPPQAQPHIKEKPEHPAWVIYIALLRLLVATIGYIHRLRQRTPQTLLRPTSTATARPHAYNTPQTTPTHRNLTLRTASKTKTYTYDGSKYNYDDIDPSYDVLNNSRHRTYKAKEQSSPICLNDMSQYRAYFVPGAVDPSGKLVFLAPLGWMAFSAALDVGSQYVEHRMSGEGEFQINLYRVGFAFATGAIPGGAGQSFKGLGALAKSRQFLNRRREFASMLKSLTNQSNAVRSRILTELSGVLKSSTFAKLFRDQAKNHFGTAFKQFAVKQAMNYKLKEVAKDLNSRNQNELQESTIECSEFKDFRAFPRGLHATIVLLPFTIPAHNIENHAAGTRVPGHLFKERCWRFWYRNSVAVSRREYDCETKKWIGERENL